MHFIECANVSLTEKRLSFRNFQVEFRTPQHFSQAAQKAGAGRGLRAEGEGGGSEAVDDAEVQQLLAALGLDLDPARRKDIHMEGLGPKVRQRWGLEG